MFEPYESTAEFATVEAIAETIRRELGAEVEVCPGVRAPEQAEPLNRVFRAVVRRFLVPSAAPVQDSARLVTQTLSRLARERLASGGLDEDQIKKLFELEAGTPDDWLCFLILVPWSEVCYWLREVDQPAR